MASIYQFLYFAKLTKISQKDGIRQILEHKYSNHLIERLNVFYNTQVIVIKFCL